MSKINENKELAKIFPFLVRSPAQVGSFVRRLRKLKDYSQMSLAEESGVAQATISRIEKGSQQAEIGTLIQILLALDAEITITEKQKSTPDDPLAGLI